MQLVIKNGLILQSNGAFLKGHIGIEHGKIAALWYGEQCACCEQHVDAEMNFISPGFIDTHVHGGMGFDFSYEKPGWEKMEARLSSNGVTSILATLSSLPPDCTLKGIDRVKTIAEKNGEGKVEIVGIHMEGPYLNKTRKGIHLEENIRPGDVGEVMRILDRAGGQATGFVKVWTMAPDIEGNLAVIKAAAAQGVSVAIAHTEAGYNTALAAFSAGANRVTHTFNTMPPLTHRYEGIITAAWQAGAYMELIADGLHVSPTIAKMFVSATDPKTIVLASDNNEFSGLPDGTYIQDGRPITISNGQMKTEDGVLAGSLLTINQCAKNLVHWGVPAGAALKMITENPARASGVFGRKGSIALGKDADLAILNGQFEAVMTIKGGRIVYQANC